MKKKEQKVYSTQPLVDLNSLIPPPGYIPGLIRGDSGFSSAKMNYDQKSENLLKINLQKVIKNQAKHQNQNQVSNQINNKNQQVSVPNLQINLFGLNKKQQRIENQEKEYSIQQIDSLKINLQNQIQTKNIEQMSIFEIVRLLQSGVQIEGLEGNFQLQKIGFK